MLKKSVRFLKSVKSSFARPYRPLIEVFISAANLKHNLRTYQQTYPGLLFAPVLKSNAYGHGLVQAAQVLDKEAIPFFVVDSLYEAIALRSEGIESEILVIGFTEVENIKHANLSRVAFTVTSMEQLEAFAARLSSHVKIHLKIDTGMHRQGILLSEIDRAIRILKLKKTLQFEGVCSHFADADGRDQKFTLSQIREWERASGLFRSNFPAIKFFHIANTAGGFYAGKASGNVARLGIGLYGINPSPFAKLSLKPVLEMRSIVSSIKTIPAGAKVGYNVTYRAKRATTVATIPAGYFEGVDRRLSNKGVFKIKQVDCPIVGRVSMNTTSIDVTRVEGVKIGDSVTVISKNPSDKNSVERMARLAKTIPWEILVHIPQHLRRTVTDNANEHNA
jgi:alanine racemase